MERLKLILKIFNKYRTVSMRELIITQGAIGLMVIATIGLVTFFNHCHEFHTKTSLSNTQVLFADQLVVSSTIAVKDLDQRQIKLEFNSSKEQRSRDLIGYHKALRRVTTEVIGHLQDIRNVLLRNSRAGPPFGKQFYCPPYLHASLFPFFNFTYKSTSPNNKFINDHPKLISKVSEV